MLNVLDSTKNAYLSDRVKLNFRVEFPDVGLYFNNDGIVAESFRLDESLCDDDSIEFVGCIANMCQITLYNVPDKIKGEKMRVYVTAGSTEQIQLFEGYVESVEIQSERLFKKITAYDSLYYASDIDVSTWYKGLTYPITIGEFRKRLCNEIGVGFYNDEVLPNDSIQIEQQYDPKSMNGLDVLKAVCQLNGACGIIDRTGRLTFRYVSYAVDGLYPSSYTFPGAYIYPGAGSIGDANNYPLTFYEDIKYQEYNVNPVDKVQIRNDEKSDGIEEGSGTNKYIIQANILAYGLSDAVLQGIATNILDKLEDVNFHPFNAKNNGLPFLEVGDTITYSVSDENKAGNYNINTFLILTRSLTGTQFLRDYYSARGTENQSVFITDLQTQIDTLKLTGGGSDMSDYYTKEETDAQIQTAIADDVERFESVSNLPQTRQQNICYLIQGDITIM